jgi:hypothetical protein
MCGGTQLKMYLIRAAKLAIRAQFVQEKKSKREA